MIQPTPPTLDAYVRFCEEQDIFDYAFPSRTPFCEGQAIKTLYAASDKGRYQMRVLLVCGKQSALPVYLASLGHDVWIVDPFANWGELNFQMRMKLLHNFTVTRRSFLDWRDPQRDGFKVVGLIDYLPRIAFTRTQKPMLDTADSVALAKARSHISKSGLVFFTAEVLDDPEKQAHLVIKNDRVRRYTGQELQTRLLSLCERTSGHAKDGISLHQSWIAR